MDPHPANNASGVMSCQPANGSSRRGAFESSSLAPPSAYTLFALPWVVIAQGLFPIAPRGAWRAARAGLQRCLRVWVGQEPCGLAVRSRGRNSQAVREALAKRTGLITNSLGSDQPRRWCVSGVACAKTRHLSSFSRTFNALVVDSSMGASASVSDASAGLAESAVGDPGLCHVTEPPYP